MASFKQRKFNGVLSTAKFKFHHFNSQMGWSSLQRVGYFCVVLTLTLVSANSEDLSCFSQLRGSGLFLSCFHPLRGSGFYLSCFNPFKNSGLFLSCFNPFKKSGLFLSCFNPIKKSGLFLSCLHPLTCFSFCLLFAS